MEVEGIDDKGEGEKGFGDPLAVDLTCGPMFSVPLL